uniref:Uncharacterized protein n=1 Tax=Micrurus carvalhoi TaxID=3147026 RepID=A0A2H6NER2_9SAUR
MWLCFIVQFSAPPCAHQEVYAFQAEAKIITIFKFSQEEGLDPSLYQPSVHEKGVLLSGYLTKAVSLKPGPRKSVQHVPYMHNLWSSISFLHTYPNSFQRHFSTAGLGIINSRNFHSRIHGFLKI